MYTNKHSITILVTLFLSVNLYAQPTNDDINSPEIISNISNWYSGDAAFTTVGATADGTSMGCFQLYSKGNVWFKFRAETTDIDIKGLTGGAQGTISYINMALFNQSFELIGCSTSSGQNAFIQSIDLNPGEDYYLTVYLKTGTDGTFSLKVTENLGYDSKDRPFEISDPTNWYSGDAAFTTIGATADGIPIDCFQLFEKGNVWFKFEAETTDIDIKGFTGGAQGSISYIKLALFNQSFELMGCSTNLGSHAFLQYIDLNIGEDYYLTVYRTTGSDGTFALQISNKLGYDIINRAKNINHISSWCSTYEEFSNITATPDFYQELGTYFNGNVWFKFQASSENISISTLSGGEYGTIVNPRITLIDRENASILVQPTNYSLEFDSLTIGEEYFFTVDHSTTEGTFSLCIEGGNDPVEICNNVHCNGVGLGIGTNIIPSDYLLAVDGKAIVEELKVQFSENWPDFVFKNDYKLRTLEEVEDFIYEYNHLPEIPSVVEVSENGFNLGEMNAMLLRKIEELTLYMIEQNRLNRAQEGRLEMQGEIIEQLKKELSDMKKE